MNNKLFGTSFAALLGSTVLFFGVTQASDFVIDKVIFPTKGFADQTYIGPYDISNLPEEEAVVIVTTGVQGWFDQAQVQIQLQDAVVPFPLETVEFDTNSTVTTAQDGEKNGLRFDVTEEAVGTFLNQQFAPLSFSEEEVTTVTEMIRENLASGRKDQIIDISSALLSSSSVETVITNITFDNVESTEEIRNLMTALDGYIINPKSTFSFLQFLETVDVGTVTESDLTSVASILYASILHTNFGVNERSIGPIAPAAIPLGFEASINRDLGVDFVFTNQNSTSFTINMNNSDTGINLSLTGYPFVYRYEPTVSNLQEFPSKTIKQYSAFVEQNTLRVKTEGEKGVQVTVFKNIVSNTDLVETKEVSEDFYPPVHKVEIHPLTTTATTDGTGNTGSTDGATGITDGSIGTTDGSGTNVDGLTDQPPTGTGADSGTGTSGNGSSSGTGNNTENDGGTGGSNNVEEEPQYDKGGNLIPSSVK